MTRIKKGKKENIVYTLSEPNYQLAQKVFLEFNEFNLKNIEKIKNNFILANIPRSLLPYPKNYIKCAYYIFLEYAKKTKNLSLFKLINEVGSSLFYEYPDYNQYKKNLNKFRKWCIVNSSDDENTKKAKEKLKSIMEDGRQNFKELFGVYQISEKDYYSSPNSKDYKDIKLIHDFGFLPYIEKDFTDSGFQSVLNKNDFPSGSVGKTLKR